MDQRLKFQLLVHDLLIFIDIPHFWLDYNNEMVSPIPSFVATSASEVVRLQPII